ncbi:hypothetical protein EVAR_67959_1 [Eumeta japonica]|uniref:Uncharacterized protein n=1 Tax=Eumeta variegata TaxID=151549 RepID=A0A4C1ZXX7_EUMVA|nr:hypothetical protein EVAR_67959_1 [Eumeta japonica]
MSSTLSKIHVTNSTGLSLNERFTAISTQPKVVTNIGTGHRSRSRSRSVQRQIPAAMSSDRNSSRANQRLLAQLQRKHKVQAALKLKRRSMRTVGGGTYGNGNGSVRIRRGSVKAFRVGANGKPIRTNSLAVLQRNLANRLGPRRPTVGGAAQRVAKRNLDRQRYHNNGVGSGSLTGATIIIVVAHVVDLVHVYNQELYVTALAPVTRTICHTQQQNENVRSRSRSRTRKGQVGQQRQQGQRNGRAPRGRSMQRRGSNNNGQRGTNSSNNNNNNNGKTHNNGVDAVAAAQHVVAMALVLVIKSISLNEKPRHSFFFWAAGHNGVLETYRCIITRFAAQPLQEDVGTPLSSRKRLTKHQPPISAQNTDDQLRLPFES